MVWYKPWTWFSDETAPAPAPIGVAESTPNTQMPAYGGKKKHKKTHRVKKGGRRHKTGRSKTA